MSNITLTGFTDEIAPGFDEQLATGKRLGLSYLEIRNVDGRNIADYKADGEGVALLERMNNHGFRVSSIGSPIGKIGVTEEFEPHFEEYKNVVALAKLFGTRYIRMFSFRIPKGDDPANHRDEVHKRLGRMIDYAAKQDVVLLHENEKGIYGDNAPRCKELLERF
jgi:sugar phosphate isomerase/epimerase